jgi:hypothetical protein
VRAVYKHKIFQELNDFSLARQSFQANQNKLTELGNIICHHGLHDIAGISLLHKHFNLDPDECLVEELADNCSYIKPQIKENKDDLTPYLWKVEQDSESGEWRYYPLEFIGSSTIGTKVNKLADVIFNHQEFLLDMAAKLSELKLTDTFGIAIPHRDTIKLDRKEIMVETTDKPTRTLTCSPTLASSIAPEELTQTLWTFSVTEKIDLLGQCYSHCISHCSSHCHVHN